MKIAMLALSAMIAAVAAAGEGIVLEIDPQAVMEILPLAAEALAIQQRAMEREAQHAVELKKKGIAEVPPCGSERYVIDIPAFGGFSFDDWGELYIDRRFVTDEEMKTVKKIEAWIAKWFPEETKKRTTHPRPSAGGAGLPRECLESFVLCLAPFAPHLGEELWQFLGHADTVAYEPWPEFDPKALVENEVEIPVQVLGKLRGRVRVPVDASSADMEAAARANPDVARHLEGRTVVKVIVVPRKMVNFVVR